jgi:hypothetical protein
MSDSERPISARIEEVAKRLCEDTEGPGSFKGNVRDSYLIKVLLMHADEQERSLIAWVKNTNRALVAAFRRERRHRRLIPLPRVVHPCAEGVHFDCALCGASADPHHYLLPSYGRGYPACVACVRRSDLIDALVKLKGDGPTIAMAKPICFAGESQGEPCCRSTDA